MELDQSFLRSTLAVLDPLPGLLRFLLAGQRGRGHFPGVVGGLGEPSTEEEAEEEEEEEEWEWPWAWVGVTEGDSSRAMSHGARHATQVPA